MIWNTDCLNNIEYILPVYNVHVTLIMEMCGKNLLVTANSHMASLIEVPLAVRSPRLTCNEKTLVIRYFTKFLLIVSSTTTVGIIVQHLVNIWYCWTAVVVQRLTTSRSGEEGDVITIVVQVHGVPASVHLLHRTTWVVPELFLSLHQLTSLPRANLSYCYRAPAIFSSPQGPHWIISGSSCTSRTLVISNN